MTKLHDALMIEPGEVDLLARAAQDQSRRWLNRPGRDHARGLILQTLSHELSLFLSTPRPPVYTMAPATESQARELARWLTLLRT
jgi:hypothetical protein